MERSGNAPFSFLFFQDPTNFPHNVIGSQPEAFLQIALRANLSETIFNSNNPKTEWYATDSCLYSAGQTADPVMVFCRYDDASLFCPGADERFIERLYSDRINDGNVNPRGLQNIGCLQRFMHHDATCDDHSVVARTDHRAFANLKFIIFRVDRIGFLAAYAQVLDTGNRLELLQERDEHRDIRDINDDGIWNGTVERHVLERHMRTSIEGGRDARVRTNDGDRVLGITAGKENLIKAAAGSERAKRMCDWVHANSG